MAVAWSMTWFPLPHWLLLLSGSDWGRRWCLFFQSFRKHFSESWVWTLESLNLLYLLFEQLLLETCCSTREDQFYTSCMERKEIEKKSRIDASQQYLSCCTGCKERFTAHRYKLLNVTCYWWLHNRNLSTYKIRRFQNLKLTIKS